MLPRFLQKTDRRDLMVRLLVLLGILGMGCILLSSFLPEKADAPETEPHSAEAYRTQLESQLTGMLSVM